MHILYSYAVLRKCEHTNVLTLDNLTGTMCEGLDGAKTTVMVMASATSDITAHF